MTHLPSRRCPPIRLQRGEPKTSGPTSTGIFYFTHIFAHALVEVDSWPAIERLRQLTSRLCDGSG